MPDEKIGELNYGQFFGYVDIPPNTAITVPFSGNTSYIGRWYIADTTSTCTTRPNSPAVKLRKPFTIYPRSDGHYFKDELEKEYGPYPLREMAEEALGNLLDKLIEEEDDEETT